MNKYIKIAIYSIISSLFVVLYTSLVGSFSLSPFVFYILLNSLGLILFLFLLVKAVYEFVYLLHYLKKIIKLIINYYSISLEFKIFTHQNSNRTCISMKRKALRVMRC